LIIWVAVVGSLTAGESARIAMSTMMRIRYHDKGIMAMIGRNAAVAEVGPHRHQLEGPFAFAAWLGLHGVLLSGFHDRVDAVMNWADDYLHHARAADLELEDSVGRIAWSDDDADRPDLRAP